MSNLTNYTTLLDWAINSHNLEDTPSGASRKNALLVEINTALNTNYSEPHLNNWLANRKPTPQRVWRYLANILIEVEVAYDNHELGNNLIRLLKLKQ